MQLAVLKYNKSKDKITIIDLLDAEYKHFDRNLDMSEEKQMIADEEWEKGEIHRALCYVIKCAYLSEYDKI